MKQLKEAGIQHLFTVLCSLHHKHRCLLLLCRIFPKSFSASTVKASMCFCCFCSKASAVFSFSCFALFSCSHASISAFQFFRLFLQLLILFLQQIVILAQNFVFFFPSARSFRTPAAFRSAADLRVRFYCPVQFPFLSAGSRLTAAVHLPIKFLHAAWCSSHRIILLKQFQIFARKSNFVHIFNIAVVDFARRDFFKEQ